MYLYMRGWGRGQGGGGGGGGLRVFSLATAGLLALKGHGEERLELLPRELL